MPLFIISIKLQSYEKLQSHSNPTVVNVEPENSLCSDNLLFSDYFLHPEAALHFAVISTAMTAVILACLRRAVAYLSFSLQVLFSPGFWESLLCCRRAFVETTKTRNKLNFVSGPNVVELQPRLRLYPKLGIFNF